MLRVACMILLIRDSSLDYVCSGGCVTEQALGRNFTQVHQVIGAICRNLRQAKTCLIGTAVTFSSRLGTKVARTRGIYMMHRNVLNVTAIDGIPGNCQTGTASAGVNVSTVVHSFSLHSIVSQHQALISRQRVIFCPYPCQWGRASYHCQGGHIATISRHRSVYGRTSRERLSR